MKNQNNKKANEKKCRQNKVRHFKSKIEELLKNVDTTTLLVIKFVKFLAKYKDNDDAIRDALLAFKEIYKDDSFYKDVKDSIIRDAGMLGMDADEYLWILS